MSPRRTYPSDERHNAKRRRLWVPSADLADSTAELTDAEFRCLFLVLAEANERRIQEDGNVLFVAASKLLTLYPNYRQSVVTALKTLCALAAKAGWRVKLHRFDGSEVVLETVSAPPRDQSQGAAETSPSHKRGLGGVSSISIWIPNYAETQQGLRSPIPIPIPNPTELRSKNGKEEEEEAKKGNEPAPGRDPRTCDRDQDTEAERRKQATRGNGGWDNVRSIAKAVR